jgi:DNA-binding IclR family transcriptional regulator
MGDATRGREGGGVQSVDRAITVLEILARLGEAGATEVAAEIAVHKSTAFRLLGALEKRGLVEQTGERGRYRLGVGLIPLAGAAADRLDVSRQGRPVCVRLAAELGETVNVAVLQGQWAVNVDQARGPAAVSAHNWVGQLTPLHCTSSGKVLLAFAEPGHPLPPLRRFTAQTLTEPRAVAAALAEVRATGIARTCEEFEVGLNAVAAPVYDRFGAVSAALSVSGPSFRLTPDRMDAIAPTLVAGAAEISRRMGFAGADRP